MRRDCPVALSAWGRSVALKVLRSAVLAALLAVGLSGSLSQMASARGAPDSFADLAEKSLPAVVNISTTQTLSADNQNQDLDELFKQFLDRQQDGEQPKPRRATSLGSGFIIDGRGFISTN